MSIYLIEKIIDFSIDLVVEIILYLPYKDIISVNNTCQKLYKITNLEYIWIQKCLLISGFQSQQLELLQLKNNKLILSFIEKVKSILQYDNYKDFFITFHKLKYPFFSFYRYLSNESYLYARLNGGLYCIKLVGQQIICQYIDSNGEIILEKSYLLTYNKANKVLKAIKYTSTNEISVEYDCKIEDSIKIIDNTNRNLLMKFNPIIANASIYNNTTIVNYDSISINNYNISIDLKIIQDMESYLGYFTSPYGPHGNEIIYTSLEYQSIRPNSLHNIQDNVISQITYDYSAYQIHGMKILGDRNVPAGKLSFIIQLHTNTLTDNISNDLLQIILSSHHNSSLTTITRNNILYCFDGFGQINGNPTTWSPSWMNCKFIIYHVPYNTNYHTNNNNNNINPIYFSVIWDYGVDAHVMQFRKLNTNHYLPLYK